jgi:uncharacterized membrane protein YbhN (UPF0104 family)
MTRPEAHLICLGLVAADLLARAWRIRWLVRATGRGLSLRSAMAINVVGDAACALTPLRIGGEPARAAVMLRSGIPAGTVVSAIGIEVVAAWPVLALFAAWLGWSFAPEWWRTAAPAVAARLVRLWPWEAAAVVLCVVAWLAARRLRGRWGAGTPAELPPLLFPTRLWPVVASVPLSLINVATRTAILPVLALTLPTPPDIGVAAFGSLALLYGQLVVPTPSGAGVVDIALLAGFAGSLGGEAPWVLAAWRFYTVGAGLLLGAGCSLGLWLGRRGRRPWWRGAVLGSG